MGRHRPDYHQPRRVYRSQLGMHPIEEYQQLTRRHFLTSAAGGIGGTALASMLGSDLTSPMAPKLSQSKPTKTSHFCSWICFSIVKQIAS